MRKFGLIACLFSLNVFSFPINFESDYTYESFLSFFNNVNTVLLHSEQPLTPNKDLAFLVDGQDRKIRITKVELSVDDQKLNQENINQILSDFSLPLLPDSTMGVPFVDGCFFIHTECFRKHIDHLWNIFNVQKNPNCIKSELSGQPIIIIRTDKINDELLLIIGSINHRAKSEQPFLTAKIKFSEPANDEPSPRKTTHKERKLKMLQAKSYAASFEPLTRKPGRK